MTKLAPFVVEDPHAAQQTLAARLNAAGAERPLQLGALLEQQGVTTAKETKRILREQQRKGGRFGEIAIRLGLAKRTDVEIALALQHGRLRGAPPVTVPDGLVVIREPQSVHAEQIRNLRSRLMTADTEAALGCFAIATTDYNVRAEYIAGNLAASLAQLRKRVLVIDADLQKPRLARFLGAPSSARGLADILTGQSVLTDVIQESCVSYLDVVTAGVARYGPQDLIASDILERVMEQARANFDHVIIMTTPISVASDARYVFAHAGSALAVARKDFTRRRNLKAMAIALKQARAQLLGAAFTA